MLKAQGFDCVDLGVCNTTTRFFGDLKEAEAHFIDEKRLSDELYDESFRHLINIPER